METNESIINPTEPKCYILHSIGSIALMTRDADANERERFSHAMTKKLETPQRLKSLAEANAVFEDTGISKAAWARAHKVSRAVVYQVLSGKKKGLRGQSHKVAVLLGLKRGRLGVRAVDMASQPTQEVAA